jgi:hypothetical protein
VSGIHLDLCLSRPDLGRATALEIKYLRKGFDHTTKDGETYRLPVQAAQPLSRYDVVKDIVRIERVVAEVPGTNGLVFVLSHHPAIWTPPTQIRSTVDLAFRIHDGATVSGRLEWASRTGPGTSRGREAALDVGGSYTMHWRGFTKLPGRRGLFRYPAITAS